MNLAPRYGERRRDGKDVATATRLSEVGDGELARRALEEALAQARLERGHPPRDGGFGHAEALGRSREASLVHDAGEKQ